jgi:hypothetical protein
VLIRWSFVAISSQTNVIVRQQDPAKFYRHGKFFFPAKQDDYELFAIEGYYAGIWMLPLQCTGAAGAAAARAIFSGPPMQFEKR